MPTSVLPHYNPTLAHLQFHPQKSPSPFAVHRPPSHSRSSNTTPSGFTESSYGSSSLASSSSRPDLEEPQSRPSTSSGLLNIGMQQLSTDPYRGRDFYPQFYHHQQLAPTSQPQRQEPQWPVVIQLEEAPQEVPEPPKTDTDTYDTRMERIESWRARSMTITQTNYVASTRSSQPSKPMAQFRCTACDTAYATRQGLKRHAQGVRTSPACRTAVEYFLE